MLFSCLKQRGFNFEETHITDEGKISALFFVLVIVTAWSMRVGVNTTKKDPTRLASHGRKRKSIFKRGLQFLTRNIVHLNTHLEELMKFLSLIFQEKASKKGYKGGF